MKRTTAGLSTYLMAAFFALLSILSVLLFSEYRFFQGQVDALLQAQHDYQRYLFSLKDKMTAYDDLLDQARTQAEELQKQVDTPKKKRKKRPIETPDKMFRWPVAPSKLWISSFFGPRKRTNGSWGFHYGVDMAALKGTEVRAAADGVVLEARNHRGYGNMIVLVHDHKYRTRYGHLDKINFAKIKKGSKVKKGELIGWVGDTGLVRKDGHDASHLHFEVYYLGKQIDPMGLLP